MFAMIGIRMYQKATADIRFQPPSLVMDKEKIAIHANRIATVDKIPKN